MVCRAGEGTRPVPGVSGEFLGIMIVENALDTAAKMAPASSVGPGIRRDGNGLSRFGCLGLIVVSFLTTVVLYPWCAATEMANS